MNHITLMILSFFLQELRMRYYVLSPSRTETLTSRSGGAIYMRLDDSHSDVDQRSLVKMSAILLSHAAPLTLMNKKIRKISQLKRASNTGLMLIRLFFWINKSFEIMVTLNITG